MSKQSLTKFFYNATDTFRELFTILAGLIVIAGALFAIFEQVSIWKGLWWALITAFTVGYGDTVPKTHAGEVLTAVLLSISVFGIIPLITARFAKIAIVNDDAFNHVEQEQIKSDLRYIRGRFELQEKLAAELDRQAKEDKQPKKNKRK